MPITTSKRPHAREGTKRLHIYLTQTEADRIERYRQSIRSKHPHLNPSASLIIAEALGQMVDGVPPIWKHC